MMTRHPLPGEKPLYWVGSSLKDITRFPAEVQRSIGFALGRRSTEENILRQNPGKVRGRGFWKS
jgi:phage-related protein